MLALLGCSPRVPTLSGGPSAASVRAEVLPSGWMAGVRPDPAGSSSQFRARDCGIPRGRTGCTEPVRRHRGAPGKKGGQAGKGRVPATSRGPKPSSSFLSVPQSKSPGCLGVDHHSPCAGGRVRTAGLSWVRNGWRCPSGLSMRIEGQIAALQMGSLSEATPLGGPAGAEPVCNGEAGGAKGRGKSGLSQELPGGWDGPATCIHPTCGPPPPLPLPTSSLCSPASSPPQSGCPPCLLGLVPESQMLFTALPPP